MDLARCLEILSGVAEAQGAPEPVPLSDETTVAVLDLARVVAHGVERKAAPLICYVVGGVLGGMDEAGQQAFIAELIDRVGAEPAEATTG
jgi:hypothetical protein